MENIFKVLAPIFFPPDMFQFAQTAVKYWHKMAFVIQTGIPWNLKVEHVLKVLQVLLRKLARNLAILVVRNTSKIHFE